MTDMYLKMNATDLIRHYAYLTQAMVHHATAVERLQWSYAKAKEELQNSQKTKKHRGRLNADKAVKIYRSRLPHVELARKYDVHYSTISNVKHGVTWSKVTGHRKQP